MVLENLQKGENNIVDGHFCGTHDPMANTKWLAQAEFVMLKLKCNMVGPEHSLKQI